MRSLTSKMLLIAIGTFLIAISAINARATYGAKISVDEPQYLLTALSIAEDQDLDISDELEEQRYLPFHEILLNVKSIVYRPYDFWNFVKSLHNTFHT